MDKKLKWGCIQPLTGGMYIGTKNAVGHPAEWILSYKGLDEVKYDDDNNIKTAANEYNLKEYLKKHNEMPPYYRFDRNIFDTDLSDLNPKIINENNEEEIPDYSDIDLVVAVPVCSGLSMAASGTESAKNARNCNMLYLIKYTLNVIKPKIYIFENAPTLMGSRGVELRKQFTKYGKEYKYNIIYYRTDTLLHNNCQKRVRTFVAFIKKDNNNVGTPIFNFENKTISIEDFFNSIPEGLTQQIECTSYKHNYVLMDFFKDKYGENWVDYLTKNVLMYNIIQHNMYNEFLNYVDKYENATDAEKEKIKKYVNHIKYKLSLGLNYYGTDCCIYKEHMPSISFRSIRTTVHPNHKRICTVREYLELMGMPHDFILYGDESNWPKIGQNVPSKTAQFIASQAIEILNNWNTCQREQCDKLYINNITQQIYHI